jgi:DNA-binding LytR/AlgR family response regulator
MKPVKEDRLFAVLDKAAERLAKSDETLLLHLNEGTVRVRKTDIFYIEAFAHNVRITAKAGVWETRAKISELEEMLGDGFVRCHRSYLVGLRHVNRITKTDVVLENGVALPLSRRLYGDVNRAFITYYTSIDTKAI